jgi:HemY protein
MLITFNMSASLLRQALGMPERVRRWTIERKQRRVRTNLINGLIRLAEARHNDAERLLLKNVELSEAPLLHYLAAAVAAQRRNAYQDRDQHLAMADRTSRKARLAVGLIQAQLQMEAQQWEQALATLSYLNEASPRHPGVLRLLMKCCLAVKEWDRLDALLPDLRRQNILAGEYARELEHEVTIRRIEQANRQSFAVLERVWSTTSKSLKEDPAVVAIYVDGLILHNHADEAERVLRTQIPKDWNPSLLDRYGALEAKHPDKLLVQMEKWLKDRPDDAVLLYSAGRQAARAQLWGRGRSYLEASIARGARSDSYRLLGELLEHMNETEAAHDCYRKGLAMIAGATGLAWPSTSSLATTETGLPGTRLPADASVR